MSKNIYRVHITMNDGTCDLYWRSRVAAHNGEEAKEIALHRARSKVGVDVHQGKGVSVSFTIGRKKARVVLVEKRGRVEDMDPITYRTALLSGDIIDDELCPRPQVLTTKAAIKRGI